VNDQEKHDILDLLAQLLRKRQYTLVMARLFRPLLIELVGRMTSVSGALAASASGASSLAVLEETASALSLLLGISPQIQRYLVPSP